tara:strand:- start:633 stop:1061 length:429 start_codon:yes stop_codon:yes gene_type:complete
MSKVTYYVETWRRYGEAESISRFCVTAPDIDKDFENLDNENKNSLQDAMEEAVLHWNYSSGDLIEYDEDENCYSCGESFYAVWEFKKLLDEDAKVLTKYLPTNDVTEEFNHGYERYKDGLEETMSLEEYQEFVKNKESDNDK